MGQRTQDQFAIPRPKVGDSGFLFGGWIPCAWFHLLWFCLRPPWGSEIASYDCILSLPFLGTVSGCGDARATRVGGRTACGALGGLSVLLGLVLGERREPQVTPRVNPRQRRL